jgi:hypothetical protein
MTPKTEEKTEKVQKIFNVAELEHYRIPEFVSVYSNSAGFGINFFDLSIVFGQIVSPNIESMLIEDRVAVTMSIEHARALMIALQDTLAAYEKTHGQIRKAAPVETKST